MAIVINNEGIIRQEVKDEEGNLLHAFTYNPNDITTLQKFWDLIGLLYQKSSEAPSANPNDLALLEKPAETAEEFAAAAQAVRNVGQVFATANQAFAEVCSGLDDIFGAGVCRVFCGGYADPALLDPLLDAVLPDFEKAAEKRKMKTDRYKKNRAQRRIEQK